MSEWSADSGPPARWLPRDRARDPTPHLFVVHRAHTDVFGTLQEHFAGDPDVQVIWDRRIADRRTTRQPGTAERRLGERRGPPPATWTALGVLLAYGGRAYDTYSPK